jgi:hypothetical protein
MQLYDAPLDTPAHSVVREMFQYTAKGQQQKIAVLIHPEAIVIPLQHPERVVGSADFRDYVREQTKGAQYRYVRAHAIDEVAPGRFIVSGNVRWSSRLGGFTDSAAFWAIVVRDGLVYRMKGCQRKDEAVAALEADDWRPSSA